MDLGARPPQLAQICCLAKATLTMFQREPSSVLNGTLALVRKMSIAIDKLCALEAYSLLRFVVLQ